MAATPMPESSAALGATPAAVVEVAGRVDARLAALLDAEAARWEELDADLGAPLQALRSLVLGGGKRLRPAFCHWGYAAAGGETPATVVDDVGAAFELLHAFALIHDDVIDDSATRRGRPAVHTAFRDEHRRQRLRGEERRFGEGVAILVGDLALVYADVLSAGLPPEALGVWNELRIELNIGQYLDVLATAQRDTDAARARRITRFKSAKYTVERPLHLGAALAGDLDGLAAPLSAYGLPLGEAFQLRDDLLGVFGDAAVLGKPVGDDLREGKSTPLLSLALERATAAQRAVLDLVGEDLDQDQVGRLQQVLVDTGAAAAIEAEIDEHRAAAIAALDDPAFDAGVRDGLTALAWFVTARER